MSQGGIGHIMSGGSRDQQIQTLRMHLHGFQKEKQEFKENERHRWATRTKDDIHMGSYAAIKDVIDNLNRNIQEYSNALLGLRADPNPVDLTDEPIDLTGDTDEEFLAWWREKAGITTTEFGRSRRMASLGTFTKRYRRRNPHASVRTIVNKYRRAQQLFA